MKWSERTWLPNLLTAFNLFLGFWAITLAVEGRILTACWLVIIASICDGLDGKLARFMHSSSEMGVEMDSLADIVSFGVAPGIILYVSAFHKLEFWGVFLSALPVLAGAWRLARYNLSASLGEKKHQYEGLPIPMQANTIVSFLLFNYAFWHELQLDLLLIPLVLVLAILMVSHVPFDGIPRLGLKDAVKNPLRTLLILAFIIALALKPAFTFFPVMLGYISRGILLALFGVTPVEDLEEEDLDSEVEIKP